MLFSSKYKTPCQAEKEFAQNAVYILNNIWNMGGSKRQRFVLSSYMVMLAISFLQSKIPQELNAFPL